MEPKPSETLKTAPRDVKKAPVRKGLTFFWLVPVAAVAIAGYLFYQTIIQQGTEIEITFNSARGLIADKTELRHLGVKVGIVKEVTLNPDFKSVTVKVQLERTADNLAKEGAKFWIVYPEIGINGISGLDTIIGGNYIRVQEGSGPPARHFEGLSAPPTSDPNSNDLFIHLVSPTMPSVGMDSPILYHHMPIGKVEDLHYDIQRHLAIVEIRIEEKYKDLVRKDTRFWNTSGLDVSVGLDGMTVRSRSLASIIFGSITLGIPDALLATSPTVGNGTEYKLYDSLKEVIAEEAGTINTTSAGIGSVLTLHLRDGNGISPGRTELRYHGIKVGYVVSQELTPDFSGVIAKVLLLPHAEMLAKTNSKIVLVWPQVKVKDLQRLQIAPDVVEGPYFRIEPGDGAAQLDFKVVESDNDSYHPIDGLVLTLRATQVGTLNPGMPVFYRGIQVGQIERSTLAQDATSVLVRVVINSKYAPLVRANSRFWDSSGMTSHLSIWSGEVRTPPLPDALVGSVSFATPNNAQMGAKVISGASFDLTAKPEDDWLKWQPVIPLGQ